MRSIVALGAYDSQYPRVKYLLGGLREIGCNVIEWNIRCQLALQIIRFVLHIKKIMHDCMKSDFILVPYPGWRMVFFAKVLRLLTGKPLIFDAHISKYNTFVEDRHTKSPSSLGALHDWLYDTITCNLADIVLIDTETHGKYFQERFGIDHKKIIRVFVGVNPVVHEDIAPVEKQDDAIVLYFYGTYIPLQGIPYILEALSILKANNYKFKLILIGSGQEEENCNRIIDELNLRSQIIQYPYTPYQELLRMMIQSDICLGIFGESNKAQNVIPNKVYDYAAMNKVFISGNSVAMRELFEDGIDYVGCKFADAKDLASKMIYVIDHLHDLKKNLDPICKIQRYATPAIIAKQLITDLKQRDVITR